MFHKTKNLDLSFLYNKFIPLVKEKGLILDLGCGSGRDSKYFKTKDFQVEAWEPNKELGKLARDYINQEVLNKKIQEMIEYSKFDGVWACASLLHLQKEELLDSFIKINKALKKNGVFYCSFKYGNKIEIVNNVSYLYIDEKFLKELAEKSNFKILDIFITKDKLRSDRPAWVNGIFVLDK